MISIEFRWNVLRKNDGNTWTAQEKANWARVGFYYSDVKKRQVRKAISYTCVEKLIADKAGGNVYVYIAINGKGVWSIGNTGWG